jgi:hypothetical protein
VTPSDVYWDDRSKAYRHKRTNRKVTEAQLVALRNALADAYEARMVNLVADYVAGTIAKVTWEDRFLTLIVEAASHGYVLGRGGTALMTDADWDELAVTVARQTAYGQRFLNELQAAIDAQRGVTPLQAIKAALEPRTAQRAALYGGAAVEGYERGNAAAKSGGASRSRLPVYPADGGTECKSRCRCSWSIVGDNERRMWVARWVTESDENVCAGCAERGRLYQRVEYPMAPR